MGKIVGVSIVTREHRRMYAGLTEHKPWVPYNGGRWITRCVMRSTSTGLRCRQVAVLGLSMCNVHAGLWGTRLVTEDTMRLEVQVDEYIDELLKAGNTGATS